MPIILDVLKKIHFTLIPVLKLGYLSCWQSRVRKGERPERKEKEESKSAKEEKIATGRFFVQKRCIGRGGRSASADWHLWRATSTEEMASKPKKVRGLIGGGSFVIVEVTLRVQNMGF